MDAKTIAGYLVSTILLVPGVLFALASVYEATRLITSAFLFLAGFSILYYIRKQQPFQVTQNLKCLGKLRFER